MAEAGSSPAKKTPTIVDAVEKAFSKNGIVLADSKKDGDSGMFAIGFSGFFGGNLRYVAAVSSRSEAGYSDFHIRTAGLFNVPAGKEGQAVNLCNSLNLSRQRDCDFGRHVCQQGDRSRSLGRHGHDDERYLQAGLSGACEPA